MIKNLLKKFVNRWVLPYGSTAPILHGACRGMRFRVTPESGYSMMLGYERDHQRFIVPKVRPGMTVYDIGANVGQYALLFSRLVGPTGRVISFEPFPPAFERLEENVKLNDIRNVTALNLALADQTGQLSFSTAPGASSMGKLSNVELTFENAANPKIQVETDRLDNIVSRYGAPDLLKIDTEGAAAVILRGAKDTLRAHKPAVYIELHGPEEQSAVSALMREGYSFQDLDGQSVPDMSKWVTPLWGVHA